MEGTMLSAWRRPLGPLLAGGPFRAGRRGYGGDLPVLTGTEGGLGYLGRLQPLLGHLGRRDPDLITGLLQGLRPTGWIGWMPVKGGAPCLGLGVLPRDGHRPVCRASGDDWNLVSYLIVLPILVRVRWADPGVGSGLGIRLWLKLKTKVQMVDLLCPPQAMA